jgi:hypothetical protein
MFVHQRLKNQKNDDRLEIFNGTDFAKLILLANIKQSLNGIALDTHQPFDKSVGKIERRL